MSINFHTQVYSEMIDNFSKTLVRTPVTKSVSNISGQESFSEGETSNITGAFFRKEDSWSQNKEGLFQGADAVFMYKNDVTLNKNDKLSYDSENYRVKKVITRRLGTQFFYNVARCFLI